MATSDSPNLAGCWCGEYGRGGQCGCAGRRSIYLDAGEASDGCNESCNVRPKSWHGLYVDNEDIPGMPELESARRNNSSESPVLSSPGHASNREQDTSSTVTVERDVGALFLRSGADWIASNNIVEEDSPSGMGVVDRDGVWCWEDVGVGAQNQMENEPLHEKHKPGRLLTQCARDLLGPSSSETCADFGVQLDKRSQTLISSLEHAIALLGLSLGDACHLEHEDFLDIRKVATDTHMTKPEIEFVSESPGGLPHLGDLATKCPDAAAPLKFPVPCTMQSTYSEPFISPLVTEQECTSTMTGRMDGVIIYTEEESASLQFPPLRLSSGTAVDYIHGSDSAHISQRSLDTPPISGWRSSKIRLPSMHSSKRSQIYYQRSTGGGVPSISMSDWDVCESGIHVNQTPNFSDSDGVFEEFVRDQETYFTPPLVLAGDVWDPMDNGAPFECIFDSSSNRPPQAANESSCTEIHALPPDSPFIPAIQEASVQVYSRELEPKGKSTFLDRIYGKSSELRSRLVTAFRSKRLRPWLAGKNGLHTEPLPTVSGRTWDRDSLQRQSSIGSSDSAKTMVSIVAPGCGFQAQFKRFIPRRFTEIAPRSEFLSLGTGSNCQSRPDSCDIYCLGPSASTIADAPQTGNFRSLHSIIRESPQTDVDLVHEVVGKQLRRIWT